MAHYLALTTSIFAAISPVAGSLYEGIETTSIAPTSVLMIHGELNNQFPMKGAQVMVMNSIPSNTQPRFGLSIMAVMLRLY